MKKGSLKVLSRRIEIPPPNGDRFRELSSDVTPAATRLGLSAFIVGGAVRDLVEGSGQFHEWDLVVLGQEGGSGEREEDSRTGARRLAEEICKIWDWRDPVAFERYGTYLVSGPSGSVEISQGGLRSSLRELSGDPLVHDALSRDFTVNALYIPLLDISHASRGIPVLDPTGKGFEDLSAKILRTPVHASLTVKDDPLRILRAARFCSTSGYTVSPFFSRVARELSGSLIDVSPERVREEMTRLLMGSKPSAGLSRLAGWGVFDVLMPEVQHMVGFRQRTPHHYPDLFRHTMRVVDGVRPDPVLRWAALLHDCGKPHTRSADGDVDRYFGHEAAGAGLALDLLTRLKAGREISRDVTELIRLHMVQYSEQWSDRAVRRFIHRTQGHLPRLLELMKADAGALRLKADKLRLLAELRDRVDRLKRQMPAPVSPLDGRRIMEILGLEPGPVLGAAKEALTEAVAEGLIPSQEAAAERFLINWWKDLGDSRN